MILHSLSLQNFRSYKKAAFDFSKDTTIVVGPNTSGKTNLLEGVLLLSTGKSSRAEKEMQAVRFDEEIARVRGVCHPERSEGSQDLPAGKAGILRDTQNDIQLEVMLTNGMVAGVESPLKRYMVNEVPKRRVDFASHLTTVSFAPSDVDIISGSPTFRRSLLDEVLEQVDRQYRIATITYTKALRQRNALLHLVQETGVRNEKQFEYWDELLITHGNYITQKREAFLTYVNAVAHEVLSISVTYDQSTISVDRLLQYKSAEVGSGVTLVGPHRDDFFIETTLGKELRNVKLFGSRGQQRLVIFQLKLLQLNFIEQETGERPLLLLDDIFSELDTGHIDLVQSLLSKQQTIMTTTHKEFVDKKIGNEATIIELAVG